MNGQESMIWKLLGSTHLVFIYTIASMLYVELDILSLTSILSRNTYTANGHRFSFLYLKSPQWYYHRPSQFLLKILFWLWEDITLRCRRTKKLAALFSFSMSRKTKRELFTILKTQILRASKIYLRKAQKSTKIGQ